MAEWKKFTGSEEQYSEIKSAENGWIVRFEDGTESCVCMGGLDPKLIADVSEYLICEPHTHAEMIKRWADTGQPVYKFSEYRNEWQLIANPYWHKEIKYLLNPPKEKQFIEVRDFLYNMLGTVIKISLHKSEAVLSVENCEKTKGFIRWLDDDWRKIEI